MKLSKLDPFEKTPNRIGELINSSDKSLKQISQEINIKPNATISIELVKELYSIREKRSSLHQEYIELDKKEKDILEQIRSAVL